VIREAMARQDKAGIARIVLYRRERPVMIEPFDKGLLLTTLRYDKTVRKPDEVFAGLAKSKFDPELIELATHIIDRKQAAFDPSHFEDGYEAALLELIRAKQKGKKPPVVQATERPANVVNLFDALKRSLAGDSGTKTSASKAPASEPPTEKAAARKSAAKPSKTTKPAKTRKSA
jgi:DNA end-binding protein Ku